MRSSLPRRSLVLPDERWASNGPRPARSSIGEYPSEAQEFVLSPVDRYRLPCESNPTSPPTWQQRSRCVGTSMIVCSVARSSLSVASSHLNLARRLTPHTNTPPNRSGGEHGADSGRE